ncbi:Aste57867_15427 [Aphanomyces stellatus]|uniref:Aste57867_15427 protein n=1 Tax=Aphanomyces stellatus TaxID=120398 RepID=A0A485L339_9STRA|nr:hypothetical protein As57867_015371 [Aphanomyces stellatus]VFT92229.1 Aste57867_15427 [Aphanomyces stellatus]
MQLCRFPHCRSYGKLDGFCLVHFKTNGAALPAAAGPTHHHHTSMPVTQRLAFTPPPYTLPPPSLAKLPDAGVVRDHTAAVPLAPLVTLARVPSLPNGRLKCFAPQCMAPIQGDAPFCHDHQHCTLMVDTTASSSSPSTHQQHLVARKRRRLSSIEARPGNDGPRYASPTSAASPSSHPSVAASSSSFTEHEHARILANLGRSC